MTFEADCLTGLLSRRGLNDWYESLDAHTVLQMMFIDLDNFKSVNDVYGHSVGDELLKTVSDIFKNCAPGAYIARLGGDEFVLALRQQSSRESIIAIARQIITMLERKQGFETIGTVISASIGILLNETASTSFDDVLFKIDTAMYKAKDNGKSGYVVFNDIAELIYRENRMEQRKEEALARGEFEIYYRPFINAQTSRLYLSEAVLVWNSPEGLKKQSEFLHIFEKDGFIKDLNLMTYEVVCDSIRKHHEATHSRIRIGIPTSGRLLADQTFPEYLLSIMNANGVETSELCISFSESVFNRGAENVIATLHILAELGFNLIIYDVGLDFSSLRYWDKLHLSAIVLKEAYFKEAFATPKGNLILRTLFAMGHDLNLRVVAEGVSEKKEVSALCAWGCNSISGPFYFEPLPLSEYRKAIAPYCFDSETRTEFSFRNTFESTDKRFAGVASSNLISFETGISNRHGAISFPGGKVADNILELPKEVMNSDSYTISMWLKPADAISWASVIYTRFTGGFMAYNPCIPGSGSAYRISEDADVLHGFHDVLGRTLPLDKWSQVCISYDSQSGLARYFINGRKIGSISDVPVLTDCKQILVGGDPFQPSYKGLISALTFFDCSKSDQDIEEMYEHYFEEKGFAGERESFWM